MSDSKLTAADYPLAEKRPEMVRGRRGKGLDDLTIEAIVGGQVTLEDLSITDAALRQQADIARSAGRATLAENFARAAELVAVPEARIMQVYELLRPGRAASADELLAAARDLRETYGAHRMADFLAEAADVYTRRGLFKRRY
jgi:propanediol dehydratase small subunit